MEDEATTKGYVDSIVSEDDRGTIIRYQAALRARGLDTLIVVVKPDGVVLFSPFSADFDSTLFAHMAEGCHGELTIETNSES